MQWWCSAQGVAWEWSWQAYPGVWAFVAAVGVAYAWGVRRNRRVTNERRAPGRRAAFFAGGLLLLWVALDWPLGALGAGYLASAHMLQFLLIALIAPPLLLLGLPPARRGWTTTAARLGSGHPLLALLIFNLVVAVTHVPAVVDRLMISQLGSMAIDLAWLLGGLAFWWPVVGPTAEGAPRLHEMVRVAYLAAEALMLTPLFAYLTFSRFPRYAVYELAPRVHDLSARSDQVLAGLLMKVGGMVIFLTAVGLLFLQWSRREAVPRAVPGGVPGGAPGAAPAAVPDRGAERRPAPPGPTLGGTGEA